MAAIWADSYYGQKDKTKLLVALAIADSARSEDGRAWPGIEFIARKSRCSGRAVQLAIQEMEKDGKLTIERRRGPHETNAYLLCSEGETISPVKPVRGEIYRPSISPPPVKSSVRGFHPIHNDPPIDPSGTISTPASASPPLSGFEEFWKAYPKRVGKGNAEKAWTKLKCDSFLPLILTRLRTLKTSADWTKDGGQFIPHPATWLNRKGWEDELFAPAGTCIKEHLKIPILTDE